jgi:hypothetical protein
MQRLTGILIEAGTIIFIAAMVLSWLWHFLGSSPNYGPSSRSEYWESHAR